MKNIGFYLGIAIVLLFVFGCKKDKGVTPQSTALSVDEYILKNPSQSINVRYHVDTKASDCIATYIKFGGANEDGSLIWLSITDSIKQRVTDIEFKSVKIEKKIHYQIFTLASTADSCTLSIYIDNVGKGLRPNYGSVFNFIYTDY